MNKTLRKAIIAGNWKMNKNRKEAAELIEALKPIAADKTCGVIICVPFTNLETALRLTEGTNIEVGAENVHFEKSGAFTGEISADMLTEMGVKYVIVGHSERRQYFGETDETVNKRTTAAIEAGMTVILCVGEMLCSIERLAPDIFAEEKGSSKPVCANVDLFSGLIYNMLGISEDIYTPLFAIARVPGWCAHRVEEVVFANRIIRPAYKYLGVRQKYKPIEER